MRSLLAFSVLVLSAMPVLAQTSPGWIADAGTGCRVWNSNPEPGETIKWTGDCPNKIAQGRGVVEWFKDGKPNGRSEGAFRDGKLNGRGVSLSPAGNRYEGEFRDNEYDGKGVYTYASGDKYEGEFKAGNFHGRGVLTHLNGDRFDGEYREDNRNGHGVLIFANGNRFEGEYRDNKPNGQGTFKTTAGDYTGTWTNGCFQQGNRKAFVGATQKECGF